MDASEHAPSGGSPGALLQFKERRKTADETRPQRGLRCATGGNEADGYSTAGAVTLTSRPGQSRGATANANDEMTGERNERHADLPANDWDEA
jgi:hypothetical protein